MPKQKFAKITAAQRAAILSHPHFDLLKKAMRATAGYIGEEVAPTVELCADRLDGKEANAYIQILSKEHGWQQVEKLLSEETGIDI